jgi:D-alanine-D-alanine ligase
VGVRRDGPPADVRSVADALGEGGFRVSVVNVEDDVDRVLSAVVVERPDFVFYMVNEVDGDRTQNALVAALLDLLGIPYTGSDPLTLTTCQNRARAHLVLHDAGVPLPRYGVVRDLNAIPDTSEFRHPLILTQTYDDTYKDEGLEAPIESREELETRVVELCKEFDLPLLIEEYIGHRRVHAQVLGNRVLEILPLTEARLWRVADEENERGKVSLAQLAKDTADRIRQLARRAYRAMDCRDIAQVDFHLDENDTPYVVDVRPMPDLDPGRPFYVAAECSERCFEDAVFELARITCKRATVRLPGEMPTVPPPAPAPAEETPAAEAGGQTESGPPAAAEGGD